MKPRIGVTTSTRSGWRIFPLVALNLWLAGGRGVRWNTHGDADIAEVDGLIVGGGDDISPALYDGDMKMAARLDPDRDAMERRLIEEALAAGKPVLGICRGAQMLNVALGGNLHQDAYAHYKDSDFVKTVLPRKSVRIEAGTLLSRVAGADEMRVNALHTQSIDRLGDGLRPAARDEGGMIQAVERTKEPMALGVQWHPEHLFYARRQRALFRALVASARARLEGSGQISAARLEAQSQAP